MLTNAQKQTKNTVMKTKALLIQLNDELNNEIKELDSTYDTERNSLRKIRDANIDTFLLIQRLEMVGLI